MRSTKGPTKGNALGVMLFSLLVFQRHCRLGVYDNRTTGELLLEAVATCDGDDPFHLASIPDAVGIGILFHGPHHELGRQGQSDMQEADAT